MDDLERDSCVFPPSGLGKHHHYTAQTTTDVVQLEISLGSQTPRRQIDAYNVCGQIHLEISQLSAVYNRFL